MGYVLSCGNRKVRPRESKKVRFWAKGGFFVLGLGGILLSALLLG
jgi:hypothetical protein